MRYFKRIDRDNEFYPEDSISLLEFDNTNNMWRIKTHIDKMWVSAFIEPKFYDNPFCRK